MTDKNFRDIDLLSGFRPELRVNEIAQLQKQHPNRVYCGVRFDESYDPNAENVDKYLAKGWQIVHDDKAIVDDRSTAPGQKTQDSLRKKPMTKKGKGNAHFVYMWIEKDKLAKNEADKVETNRQRYISSSTGRKAVQKGGHLHITDTEVNESNMNSSSNE